MLSYIIKYTHYLLIDYYLIINHTFIKYTYIYKYYITDIYVKSSQSFNVQNTKFIIYFGSLCLYTIMYWLYSLWKAIYIRFIDQ